MKRTLPNHEEGEIRVIGGILLHPEEIGMVSAVLEPEDFFSPFRRQLFETLISMNENSKVIDPTTLLEEFLLNSKIKREVALGYITKIQEETVTSAAFHYYAKKLKEMRQRREIMSAADKAIEHACRVSEDIEDTKSASIGSMREATAIMGGLGLAVRASETISVDTEAALSNEPMTGAVRTGIQQFDTEFGGLYPGIPYLVAARTSMGKSVWVMNAVVESCLAGRRVVWFSFEENRQISSWRMISRLSQVPLWKFFQRCTNNEEKARAREASEIIKTTFDLDIVDTPISSQAICDYTRQANDQAKVDLAVVDILTKVKEPISYRNENEFYTHVSKNISSLPSEINAPVIATHQVNRSVESREDKMPTLSDLRASGSLEQDFKTIMFLLRPAYYDKSGATDEHDMSMGIAKNANGPTGELPHWCDMPRMTIKGRDVSGGY